MLIGVGQSSERLDDPGYRGRSPVELGADAAREALADTGADPAAVAARIDLVAAVRQFEASAPGAVAPLGASDNYPRSVAARIGADAADARCSRWSAGSPRSAWSPRPRRRSPRARSTWPSSWGPRRCRRPAPAERGRRGRPARLDRARRRAARRPRARPGDLHRPRAGRARRARAGAAVRPVRARPPRPARALPRRLPPGHGRAVRAVLRGRRAPPARRRADGAHRRRARDPHARRTARSTTPSCASPSPATRSTRARRSSWPRPGWPTSWAFPTTAGSTCTATPTSSSPRCSTGPTSARARPRSRRSGTPSSSRASASTTSRRSTSTAASPIAVRVVTDALGLAADDPRGLTVTGGLPFFGGPGNDYSMHAIADTVTALRARPGAFGLVGANGGALHKYSAGVYSTTPAAWQAGRRRRGAAGGRRRPRAATPRAR